ncbi:hypothetical protein NW755_010218 [Fusarium falciforme]|uniref:Acyltransferase 3 domain-containing protein n=1 Tax=Fusarium falciforme TaxID=195108 RepID=A0A9W8QZS2_9HYPO|nr:hypothetical protein NW755_010218 [Fusarium falciforme]
MLPSPRAKSRDGLPQQAELLQQDTDRDHEKAALARKNRDKIRCLDGLRGIACLIVFNYHFFWPWTPAVMLGYGALAPRSPEPYWNWPSLPIVCLLHRGRPMVAIFFAISGYVICRHILRSIHERRLEDTYQKLASAVFRRVFRLYIPPTISMFIVAMLAQIGAFKSEFNIYKGPDSVYINATITTAQIQLDTSCVNGTSIMGAAGVANYLGLQGPLYLGNTTANLTDLLCVNSTSRLYGPDKFYKLEGEVEAELAKNTTDNATTTALPTLETLSPRSYLKIENDKRKTPSYVSDLTEKTESLNDTNPVNLTWVQFGGSWEEHPFIHDNMTYALKNFTRAYAEWANPFNFGHYHPRYDPHTFTIPMELRGSMVLYIFLLGTAALKARWRLRFAGFLSAYSLFIGRWDMATFLGGALLSELDIRRSDPNDRTIAPPSVGVGKSRQSGLQSTPLRVLVIFVALYFLSYPDVGAEYTPGFVFLSYFVPKYYIPMSGWMFYQSMGALLLVPCILRSPLLSRLLEGRVAQYLGKISFSLYLVHGPVLHCIGFWIMPRLFDNFGRLTGYAIGYVTLISITFYLTNLWHRKVDVWSMTVGRRVEKMLSE